jgi:hypothetical protein
MSFEESPDASIWRCDTCGLVADFPPHDFYRSLSELKARGWRIERDRENRQWVHYCGKCWRAQGASNIAEFLDRKPRASRG